MERCFNIAGTCFSDEHYMLSELDGLLEVRRLVRCGQYLDTFDLFEGWMAVFDEDMSKPWDEKIYTRDATFDGKTLHIVGL